MKFYSISILFTYFCILEEKELPVAAEGKGRLPGRGGMATGLQRMCRTKGQNML